LALGGGSATPKGQKKFKDFFLKKMGLAIGGGRSTPKAKGWLRPPQTGSMGWLATPSFFFFFLSFFINFFNFYFDLNFFKK
jgi:membrane-associated protease RseP (regulator of RpoE activity)